MPRLKQRTLEEDPTGTAAAVPVVLARDLTPPPPVPAVRLVDVSDIPPESTRDSEQPTVNDAATTLTGMTKKIQSEVPIIAYEPTLLPHDEPTGRAPIMPPPPPAARAFDDRADATELVRDVIRDFGAAPELPAERPAASGLPEVAQSAPADTVIEHLRKTHAIVERLAGSAAAVAEPPVETPRAMVTALVSSPSSESVGGVSGGLPLWARLVIGGVISAIASYLIVRILMPRERGGNDNG